MHLKPAVFTLKPRQKVRKWWKICKNWWNQDIMVFYGLRSSSGLLASFSTMKIKFFNFSKSFHFVPDHVGALNVRLCTLNQRFLPLNHFKNVQKWWKIAKKLLKSWFWAFQSSKAFFWVIRVVWHFKNKISEFFENI